EIGWMKPWSNSQPDERATAYADSRFGYDRMLTGINAWFGPHYFPGVRFCVGQIVRQMESLSRFQHNYRKATFGKFLRDDAAACAGSDDQNVGNRGFHLSKLGVHTTLSRVHRKLAAEVSGLNRTFILSRLCVMVHRIEPGKVIFGL